MKKIFGLIVIVVAFCAISSFGVEKASAASLANASASASTSRPSPSSPLSSADPLTAGSSQVTVFNNVSTYLSSDSAKFFKGGAYSETINIATTSADKLTAYFTAGTANLQNKTSVLAVPITAVHTIAFTTQSAIPSGGKITITYPNTAAADTNQASPSANTWMFNGLTAGNIVAKVGVGAGAATIAGGACVPTAGTGGTAPSITCTTSGGTISSGVPVWIFIGCTAFNSVPQCSTPVPTLINPTNTGTRGTASVKSIVLQTKDASSNLLDASTLKMGTIESVFVVAHVDPTFSFTISGSPAAATVNTNYTCTPTYGLTAMNSGFATTPTEVNLGTLSSSSTNYAAQALNVTSNTGVGYAITATSSGFLLNPSSGEYIVNAQGDVTGNDAPVPAVIPTGGTGGYGITACDMQSRVNTTTWGNLTPKFANPSPNYYYTLVNYAGTPSTPSDLIMVIYAARAGSTTPPGDYWQIITYTASVTF